MLVREVPAPIIARSNPNRLVALLAYEEVLPIEVAKIIEAVFPIIIENDDLFTSLIVYSLIHREIRW